MRRKVLFHEAIQTNTDSGLLTSLATFLLLSFCLPIFGLQTEPHVTDEFKLAQREHLPLINY